MTSRQEIQMIPNEKHTLKIEVGKHKVSATGFGLVVLLVILAVALVGVVWSGFFFDFAREAFNGMGTHH
jgi:hypothetical protein